MNLLWIEKIKDGIKNLNAVNQMYVCLLMNWNNYGIWKSNMKGKERWLAKW